MLLALDCQECAIHLNFSHIGHINILSVWAVDIPFDHRLEKLCGVGKQMRKLKLIEITVVILISAFAVLVFSLSAAAQTAIGHLNKGAGLMRKGRWSEALLEFQKAIKMDPSLAAAYYNMGILYMDILDRKDEGFAALTKALDLGIERKLTDNKMAELYVRLGSYKEEKGDLEQAVSYFKEALRYSPGSVSARNALKRAENKLRMAVGGSRESHDIFNLHIFGDETRERRQFLLKSFVEAKRKIGELLDFYPYESVEIYLMATGEFSQLSQFMPLPPPWDGSIKIDSFSYRISRAGQRYVAEAVERVPEKQLRWYAFHQYMHYAVDAVSSGNAPMWLHEGLALYAENRFAGRSLRQYRKRVRNFVVLQRRRNRPSWRSMRELEIRDAFDPAQAGGDFAAWMAYIQSLDVVKYLMSIEGEKTMVEFLKRLGEGLAPEESLKDIYNVDYEEIERLMSWK